MAQDTFIQHCRQEAETAALAQTLGQSLRHFFQESTAAHVNIALEGDLGAGKTTFARHLIQSLGFEGRVKSPTYTLCEPYPLTLELMNQTCTDITVHHFDLYRMRDPLEWQEAGFAEHFDEPGFCLVEWPDKAEGTLPGFDIQIHLAASNDEHAREIRFQALSQNGSQVLKLLHA